MVTDGTDMIQRFPKGFLVKSYLAHSVIFNEGTQGNAAYILAEGEVEIFTSIGNRKKVLTTLQPVSIFGEMALFLDDKTRTASAITTEDSQVVIIAADALEKYMEGAPQVLSSIMSVLTHRLKATTKKASMAPNVPMGVARMLNLFVLNGQKVIKYDSFVRELAIMFLYSKEKIEQIIMGLAKHGVLKVGTKNDIGTRMITIHSNDIITDITQLRKEMD